MAEMNEFHWINSFVGVDFFLLISSVLKDFSVPKSFIFIFSYKIHKNSSYLSLSLAELKKSKQLVQPT